MQRKLSVKLYLSIIATGLTAFCGVLIETAMNVTYPTLMAQFNVNTATIQWLTTAYLLVVAVFVPLSSFLKQRFTIKQLFVFAASLFIVGLLICTFTNHFGTLLLGRIIQGFGTGVALPLMFNIILEQAPIEKLGFFMGIGTLVTAVAPALGPTYGGLLVETNWHLIFGLLLVVMVIAFTLGIYAITQVTPTKKVRLDWPSWISIALVFVGLILGLNSLSTSIPMTGIYLVIAVISLTIFISRSLKIANPLIKISVFKNKSFTLHLISFLLFQVINVGAAFVLPNYLQIVNQVSPVNAGLLLLPGAAIGAILAPFGGRMYDAFGIRKPAYIGLTCQFLGVVLLFALSATANIWMILLGYVLVMLGPGFTMGNTMTNGLAQIPQNENADGNAIFNTLQQFAGAFGTSIASLVMSIVQNKSNYASSTAIGAQHAFFIMIIFVVINTVSLLRGLKFAKE